MGTYQKVLEKVGRGSRYKVDFKKRELKVDGKAVDLTNGDLGIEYYDDLDDWLDEAENLYDAYKYSRPTKTSSDNKRKAKFKALTADELVEAYGHAALSNPKGRDEAQAELELFILLSLVNGSLKPEELFAKDWFYQGCDKSFILRKDWF